VLWLADIVDSAELAEVVWTSAVAALGVTLAFALAIRGGTRAVELRRDGRVAAAGAHAVLMAVALLVVGGAVVLGIVAMTGD
jgi:hypothetical protein